MEQLLPLIMPALITTLLGGMGKIAIDFYENSNVKINHNSKNWKSKTRKDSFSRYAYFLLFCIFLIFIFYFMAGIIYGLINSFEIEGQINFEIFIMGSILYSIFFLFFNIFSVPKKKLISNKKKEITGRLARFIWNCPLILSYVAFVVICFCSEYPFLIYLVSLVMLIMEIWAGFYLDNKITYQFKKVKLILDDNSIISNINSDSFCVKAKWFVGVCSTYKEEKEIRVPQEKVKRIEYYEKQF